MLVVPMVYELCSIGPYIGAPPRGSYINPSPYTSHTVQFDCAKALPLLNYARWRICWRWFSNDPANAAIVRLYSVTPDVSGPEIPMAYFNSKNMGNPGPQHISNDGVDLMFIHGLTPTEHGNCCATLPALLKTGVFQNIGFDVSGDNIHTLTVYTSRLEIGWIIP